MSHTVLVTGATGKTGRRLIPVLVRRGVAVRAASRTLGHAGSGVEPVRFDWNDEGTYSAAAKGVDAIYVVPGSVEFMLGDAADRVRGLLDTAAAAGVGRVVLLSALGVDQVPPEQAPRQIELAVEASGIPATILRPGPFMQNFSEDHWGGLDVGIRERDEFALPGGGALVNFVSTEDIAAVAAATLTGDGHAGKGYTVLGPKPITFAEVAEHISAAAGRRVRYVDPGDGQVVRDQVRDQLVAAGAAREFADYYVTEMLVAALSNGAYGVRGDDVATVTGREPVSFGEYAVAAAAAWRR